MPDRTRQVPGIHPELQSAARMMPPMDFNAATVRLMRLLDRFQWGRKSLEDIRIENMWVPRPDASGQTRLRVYTPKTHLTSLPWMLWLHGGGYILGKPEQDDLACIQYARESGVAVVSVAYRYAPEHPFPHGLEDCYAALKWAAANAARLGMDAGRFAIGGDSAGGGLAAALIQLACDRAEIQPRFQLLVYPMLDDRTVLRRDQDERTYLAWTQASNRFGWESYLGGTCGQANPPAYAVPARRTDLSGLPPAWIGVGTLDLFHDEDVAYAQQLTACGVACDLVRVPGAFHGFDIAGPRTKVVRDFRAAQTAALKQNLF
jgi:acetyl esterase/lipase